MARLAALGLKIETGDVERGERALTKLDIAAQKVEAAKDRLAAASSRYQAVQARENASDAALRSAKASVTSASTALASAQQRLTSLHDAAASAALGQASANNALAAAQRAASFQTRNLQFQLIDIAQGVPLMFQSLSFGLLNLANQGAQIAQVYGPDEGGAARAFRESAAMAGRFAVRLGPIAAAAGLAALAMRGLQNDINAAGAASVTMGQLGTAAVQELGASLMTAAAPAIDRLGGAFNRTSDLILTGLTVVGDSVINTFVFAYDTVLAYWNHWPSALGDIGVRAAQGLINQVRFMAREVITSWNELMNSLGLQQFMTDAPARIFPDITLDNPYAGGSTALEAALQEAYSQFENSPFGDFLARVSDRASALALAAASAADGVGAVGRAASQAGQPMDLLSQTFNAANDNIQMFALQGAGHIETFFNQIQNGTSFADAFRNAWTSALSDVASQLIRLGSQNLFSLALGGAGGGGGLLGGLLGSFGGFRAHGGPVQAGKAYGIGERGPELFVPNTSGFVIPNHQLMAANNNQPRAANINATFNINGSVSRQEMNQVVAAAAAQLRAEFPDIAVESYVNYVEGGGNRA